MTTKKKDYEAYAHAKFLRANAFKLRKVADVVRGRNAKEALQILKRMPQRAASVLYKVLHSAVSNAFDNKSINSEELTVSLVVVNQGQIIKRFQPRARGRAFSIKKPTAHIVVGLNKE